MKAVKYSMPKQIANDIEEKIKNGRYKIGDKLPTEPQLVTQYDASRNTIREAVQSLIHAGILEAKQGNGTYVVAKDRLQVDLYGLMNEVRKGDVVEVRTLLEVYILESAILHATDADIMNIEDNLCIRNSMHDKVKEYTKADIDFHISIALATHNELLIKMYQYVSQFFVDFIATSTKSHLAEQGRIDILHTDLVIAIKNKNIINAKSIITEIINL